MRSTARCGERFHIHPTSRHDSPKFLQASDNIGCQVISWHSGRARGFHYLGLDGTLVGIGVGVQGHVLVFGLKSSSSATVVCHCSATVFSDFTGDAGCAGQWQQKRLVTHEGTSEEGRRHPEKVDGVSLHLSYS